jgi:peptidoglycan/LPS O-acetylase OafA/YrhL
VLLLGLLGSALWLPDVHFREMVLALATPYLVLFIALVPGGWLRHYNRLGDYSYGLYIYGFPTQQSVLVSRQSSIDR